MLEEKLNAGIRAVLEETRADVIAELRSGPTPHRRAFLSALLDLVDDRIVKIGGSRSSYLANRAAPWPMLGIDPCLLRVLATYRTPLLPGVTCSDCLGDITSIIRRSINVGRPLEDVVPKVGRLLPDKGIFLTIEERAEAVVHTEYHRVLSTASQLSLEESARVIPDLRKKWVCAVDERTRPAHRAAHGQIVPVRKPFVVGGEELMYPSDLSGSTANTLNCRCTVVPVLPGS
jgi:hypothetical protein